MPLTLSLQPDFEAWVEQEATREGVTPSQLVVRALDAQRFAAASAHFRSEQESDLLLQINEGFPEVFWNRFRYLRERLEAETLTTEERREFLQMNSEVEGKNADRMAILLQLAQLRHVTLSDVMHELGISSLQAS